MMTWSQFTIFAIDSAPQLLEDPIYSPGTGCAGICWCTPLLVLSLPPACWQGEQVQLQHGVLRTNCIDCLDRTNVAQFAYGLAAMGQQLHGLGLADSPNIDAQSSAACALMDMYETMGNVLSRQVCCSLACIMCLCGVHCIAYLRMCCKHRVQYDMSLHRCKLLPAPTPIYSSVHSFACQSLPLHTLPR